MDTFCLIFNTNWHVKLKRIWMLLFMIKIATQASAVSLSIILAILPKRPHKMFQSHGTNCKNTTVLSFAYIKALLSNANSKCESLFSHCTWRLCVFNIVWLSAEKKWFAMKNSSPLKNSRLRWAFAGFIVTHCDKCKNSIARKLTSLDWYPF